MRRIILFSLIAAIVPVTLHAEQSNETQQQPSVVQELFASPDEAVKTFQAAAENHDKAALNKIFGPQVNELLTGDDVQDAKNARKLAAVMGQGYKLVKEGDDKMTIEVAPDSWPMPIPLVKANGQWYFDTAAGKEEIISRHIGKDELHAIGVCRAYVTAQQQYASTHPDAKHGVHYARKFNDLSPLGSLLKKQPFHGYYFRILTRHGEDATGYALVAYPEHWDQSGIMTFIVNQDGKVYQRNFAEQTSRIARAIKEYNPDSEWTLVQDEGVFHE